MLLLNNGLILIVLFCNYLKNWPKYHKNILSFYKATQKSTTGHFKIDNIYECK